MTKSESEIEQDLESVIGSMALSGFTIDDETVEDCRAILRGELDGEAHVAELIEKIREKKMDANQ